METSSVTREQLEKAVALQQECGEGRIGEWLLRLGFVSEHQVTLALSRQYGLPVINLRESDPRCDAATLVPAKIARCFLLLPVGYDDHQNALRIAVSPPLDFQSQEAMRRMIGKGLITYIGDQSRIRSLLDLWYQSDDSDEEAVFSTLDDLLDIGRATVSLACSGRAENIRMELLDELAWTRIDFATGSLHRICRQVPAPESVEHAAPAGFLPCRAEMAC